MNIKIFSKLYQTTKSINGVQSRFTPNVDAVTTGVTQFGGTTVLPAIVNNTVKPAVVSSTIANPVFDALQPTV